MSNLFVPGKHLLRRNMVMPTYDYRCETCGKLFSIHLSMAEHEKASITCPDCREGKVVQQYSSFYAKTSKKS
jgi:putative FmdB family regulatory protein